MTEGSYWRGMFVQPADEDPLLAELDEVQYKKPSETADEWDKRLYAVAARLMTEELVQGPRARRLQLAFEQAIDTHGGSRRCDPEIKTARNKLFDLLGPVNQPDIGAEDWHSAPAEPSVNPDRGQADPRRVVIKAGR